MKKKSYIFILSAILLFCANSIALFAKVPKIHEKYYMAVVRIDDDSELSETGMYVPYFITTGYDEKSNTFYGSMVRPKFVSYSGGYRLDHAAITNGFLKGTKKLIFNLVQEGKTVYKKMRAKIRNNGKYLQITIKNSKNKKFKFNFEPCDPATGGVFINKLNDKLNPDFIGARVGNTYSGLRFSSDGADDVSASIKGDFCGGAAKREGNLGIRSSFYTDTLNYDGNKYWAYIGADYFEYQRQSSDQRWFLYTTEYFNRSGYLSNMGGNGESPALSKKIKTARPSKKYVAIKFYDVANTDPGYMASVKSGGTKAAWIMRTDYYPNDGYIRVDVGLETGFKGKVTVTITNPDGTSSSKTVNVPR